MDSYEIGLTIGNVLSIIGGFLVIYCIIKISNIIKYIFKKLFPNPTKEILETYLFWLDFVKDITTSDELQKKLSKIKNKKVYQDEFGKSYLTHQEADAFNIQTKEITIQDILNSEVSRLTFYYTLERISMYSKQDLKNISKDSYMVWFITLGCITTHLVIRDDKFIYPKDYNKENEFRYGYKIVHNENGLRGLYDIEKDKLVMSCKYKHLTSISNIIEYSIDLVEYVLYDVEQKEILATNYKPLFYDLPTSVRNRIDLSKIELKDYMMLLPKQVTKNDLIKAKLWGATVAIVKVPSNFEDIIEDSSNGTIEYDQACSADIFDMTIELPVNFKKTNGEYVSLGIKFEDIILDKKSRQRLSMKEKDNLDTIQIAYEMYRTYDYQKDIGDYRLVLQAERALSNAIWDDITKLPETFESVVAMFKEYSNENDMKQNGVFEHIAKRFGYLIFALDKFEQLTSDKEDTALHWFVKEAIKKDIIDTKFHIDIEKTNKLRSDKKLIDFLTLMYVALCAKDDDVYLEALINIVNTMWEWYAVVTEPTNIVIVHMMLTVATCEVNKKNANAFLEFFEQIPNIYKDLNYYQIMQLKKMIKKILLEHKPQDNKIFDDDSVKDKQVLLNFMKEEKIK